MNIVINGFGRIGRSFFRALLLHSTARELIVVKAINIGPADPLMTPYLFQYDSVMGTYTSHSQSVRYEDGYLIIDTLRIKIIAEKEASKAPWKELDVDWVVECSGKYTQREKALEHITAGARNVLISAPAKGADCSVILGVNENVYIQNKHIVSLGSCTTNALMPLIAIIDKEWGIESAVVVTTHAYTSSQALLDGFVAESKDMRLARAAGLNIIPAKTGAQRMVGEIFPHLSNKIAASSLRVPVPKVSLVSVTWTSDKALKKDDINEVMRIYGQQMSGTWKIFDYVTAPLVSSDYAGSPFSVLYDSLLTEAIGNMGYVSGWYDNEWGYSNRMVDFLLYARR